MRNLSVNMKKVQKVDSCQPLVGSNHLDI